jgi:hypothetical protein
MKYKIMNHPYTVIDFSGFEHKDPGIFAEHLVDLIYKKIPAHLQLGCSENILFLDIQGIYCFNQFYILDEEVEIKNDVSMDMLEVSEDLLQLEEED